MNKIYINEAIYASSNGAVVERRKSVVVPVLLLLAGLAMLIVNYMIENGDDANNLKSTLVLAGGAMLLLGVIQICVALFGSGVPYHKVDKCFLTRKHYSFDRSKQEEVVRAVNSGDRTLLDTVPESNVTGVLVVCYYSSKSNFVAMQAFEYEEFSYMPITDVKIVIEQ